MLWFFQEKKAVIELYRYDIFYHYTSIDILLAGNIGGFPLAKNCTNEPFLYQ
jgi:hypothetical protein